MKSIFLLTIPIYGRCLITQDHLVHDDDMKEKLKTEGRVTQSCRECNSIVNVYDHGEASVMLADGHNPLWNRV